MTKKKLVICAAVKYKKKVWRGNRHADAIRAMNDELSYTMTRKEMSEKCVSLDQGFITSENKYVDRDEAYKIALNAGQVKKNTVDSRLFSEDLY